MNELRLGIIGAGRHSTRRLFPTISRLENVTLAAVCDFDETRAADAARRFGAPKIYKNHQEMFASAQLDAVAVCIGPQAHADISIEAMKAGIHVYTEKPPAISSDSAYLVLQASQEYNRICMTGFKKRYAPAFRQAHDIIQSQQFGQPAMLSIWRSAGYFEHAPEKPTTWFLLDMGIHVIDLSRYLFGEVVEVSAWARGQDTYVVHFRFANQALGSLNLCAKQSWGTCSERVDITGDNRQFIRVENGVEMRHYERDNIRTLYQPNFSFSSGDSLYETGFVSELAEFVTAIRSGLQPETNIASGYQTMKLYEAIRDSAHDDGKKVLIT